MKIGSLKLFEKVIVGEQSDHDKKRPLLIRWILFRIPAFGIYIHKFCRSDYDRSLHDHPWPFIAVILKGGYIEVHDQTRDGQQEHVWRGPGSVLLRPAEWRHRVILPKDTPSWSLIIVGRRIKWWGFFLPDGWCWWRKHNYALGICEEDILWEDGSD